MYGDNVDIVVVCEVHKVRTSVNFLLQGKLLNHRLLQLAVITERNIGLLFTCIQVMDL
jgi:hypothetical protein